MAKASGIIRDREKQLAPWNRKLGCLFLRDPGENACFNMCSLFVNDVIYIMLCSVKNVLETTSIVLGTVQPTNYIA